MRARGALLVLLLGALGLGATPPEGRVLRVCADPANLPFSNDKREGFENRIAEVVAKRLGARVEYTWWAQRRGFFRNTLNAGTCDVVVEVPKGLDMAKTTKPYFRSTFAFVTKKDRGLGDLRSIDDPRLRSMTIGVPLAGDDGANPAPVHALARRGIVDGVRGYPLYGEIGRTIPAAVEAVARGEIDVAILWGPVAGAGAKKSTTPLVVVPVAEEEDAGMPFAFDMAMGVRKKDQALASDLDRAIELEQKSIAAILAQAGVPVLPPKEVRRAP